MEAEIPAVTNQIKLSPQPFLVIISGPTCGGKSTLLGLVMSRNADTCFKSVSMTTRRPQGKEKHGVDYFFVSDEHFAVAAGRGLFLETATVHGRSRYGTPTLPVISELRKGKMVIMQIDVQGCAKIRNRSAEFRELDGRIVTVFISADRAMLEKRLRNRDTDRPMDEDEIKRRLQSVANEMEESKKYDIRIESGTAEEDYAAFVQLVNLLIHRRSS